MSATWRGAALLFLSILNFIASITTVVGNSLIIQTLRRNRSLNPPSKALLFCLALSDLGVGLVVQPILATATFAKGENISSIADGLKNHPATVIPMLTFVSLWTLTAIAVDRFLALHLRQSYRVVVTLKRVVPLLVSFWIFGSVSIIAWLRGWGFVFFSTNLIVCILVSSFAFANVFIKLRHHQVQVQNSVKGSSNMNALHMVRYKKSVHNMTCVYCLFLITYLPHGCVVIIALALGLTRNQVELVVFITITLICINSTLNPFVYCWRIREIRQSVQQSLHWLCCKCLK